MADINDINAAQTVKVVGSDGSGVEQTPVQSTSAGALQVNLRNNTGTELGTVSNPLITNANLSSGQLVPTISNKFRIRYNISDVTLPNTNAYQTIYTRNGTGLFFGFQIETDNSKVNVRLTIDSGVVFDLPLDDIKTFHFNDTTDGRIQMGGFLTAIGNVLDFSSRFAIPYSSSILLEVASNDGANHKNKRYMVIQTEDT